MLQTLKHSLALCFLFFCATSNAETITHNFHSKSFAGTLVNDGSTTRSTNDGIVYTRGGDAEFYYGTGTSNVCLNLFTSGDFATISPAFSNLDSVEVNYLPSKDLSANLLVQISANGSSWSTVTPTRVHDSGHFMAVLPTSGDYYVKILRSGGEKISVTQITYYYTTSSSDCNCFIYTPE